MAPKGPTPDKARMGLPHRWLHCPKTGTLVNNLFFPFKTPLCAMYDKQISERKHRFHPADVFSHPHLHGKKIGLWIDLTNTDRYYFREEVTEKDCIYKKMAMTGVGVSPTKEETEKFIEIVQDFRAKSPDLVVGVHCTHGFNRTGFLIAAYLFQVEEYGIDAAIGEFAMNRPSGIYKQDYINDLFERYDPLEEDRILAPEKPNWEMETMNGARLPQFDSGDPSTSQQAAPKANSNSHASNGNNGCKQFMDGLVKGVTLCDDVGMKSMLQAKVQNLCKYKKSGFPGLQPVSLCQDNIKMLESEPYMVSWKADGMRYIIYIHDGNVYAFDRDNEVFEIKNLEFIGKRNKPLMETVVDTEVIIDKETRNGVTHCRPRILIYDIMRLNGVNLMKEPFDIRFECIMEEIIKPRLEAFKNQTIRSERQVMSVRRKDFYFIEATAKLLNPSFVEHTGHAVDGLIFQPTKMPYETGRCDKVLKWKPPSHNSVDFLLKVEKVQREGMLPEWNGYLYVQNGREPFGTIKAGGLRKYHNKIIECTLIVENEKPREWKFMRERTDKSLPNGFQTANNVLDSMLHPLEENFLLDYIKHAQKVLATAEQHHPNHEGPPDAKRQRI